MFDSKVIFKFCVCLFATQNRDFPLEKQTHNTPTK